MADEEKVEVNKDLLKELFSMAKMEMPADVTDEAVMDAMIKIKMSENNMAAAQEMVSQMPESFAQQEQSDSSNNILVIDDIGVVTYQMRVLLQNLGYNVKVAKDIFSGINSFVHSSFSFVVMDLFVSTEQEGYALLNETKKIITQNNLPTKIIIITASNKAENKVKCLNGGADFFVKKDVGWQDKIIDIIENNNPNKKEDPFQM